VTAILCSTSGCGDPAVDFGQCSFHSARSNRIEFMGRTYSRRPVGYQKVLVFLMCSAFVGWVFADITPPSGGTPAPVKAAAPLFWPANSDPGKMCWRDGGASEVLAAGDATQVDPLPAGSSVVCVDESVKSVVVP
jgi:hypothetical protein